MTHKARIVATLLIATLILASNPNLLAQDASHKLSAMDEFQIQLPTDPQISPDGKRIVYVRRFADPMTDKRYSNLWRSEEHTSELQSRFDLVCRLLLE